MPGGPIDPENIRSVAQDPSYTYAPTAGAWAKAGSMWCIDATGHVVTTNDTGALHVYATAADLLARSSASTSTTFTTSEVEYQLTEAAGNQAIASQV